MTSRRTSKTAADKGHASLNRRTLNAAAKPRSRTAQSETMLTARDESIRQAEAMYPGFRKTLAYYESLKLPPCPTCGSTHTAKVSAGLVGRNIALAGATTKMKLVPNGHPADFHCGACDQFFDVAR